MSTPLMCAPELLQQDLSGRRYIVTGANSGIGLVTARQLVKQGADVTLACRRPEDGERAAAEFTGPGSAEVRVLDLGDLASVRTFVSGWSNDHGALHGLVNNAGVMNTPEGRTKDGFETQIGVNHLGHVLLTELLLGVLRATAPARIVILSSCFHDKAQGREGEIVLDDLHFEAREYDGWTSYAQSKLANVLHAKALAERLEGTGVTPVSVHPGWVRTRLIRHSLPLWVQDWLLRPVFRMNGLIEPWEGAQTTLHALLAPEVEDQAGAYYSQTGTYRDKALNRGGWPLTSPNPQAHDMELARALDTRSRELVGIEGA